MVLFSTDAGGTSGVGTALGVSAAKETAAVVPVLRGDISLWSSGSSMQTSNLTALSTLTGDAARKPQNLGPSWRATSGASGASGTVTFSGGVFGGDDRGPRTANAWDAVLAWAFMGDGQVSIGQFRHRK